MAEAIVVTGSLVGDETKAFPIGTLCDVSANSNDGIPPSAWVEVVIVPENPVTVTPDDAGHLLHCLWEFTRPTVGRGKRRQYYPNRLPTPVGHPLDPVAPIRVETDPDTFYIGTDVSLSLVGGAVGDKYFYSVTYGVTRNETELERTIDVYEPAFQFELTTLVLEAGILFIPELHTHFSIVSGTAEVRNSAGVFRLDTPGLWVPLNMGQFAMTANGIYKTKGAI